MARKQRHRRELAALVDADAQRLLLADDQLDPASALGNDAAGIVLLLARLGAQHEVDAGGAVKLADDDALGPVDDELAAAEHDRHVAEIDLFLDRLLFDEPQPDAERAAVGQPELAALGRRVARLAQLVAEIFQPILAVVALDGKDFAQDLFDSLAFALARTAVELQEAGVRFGLNAGQVADFKIVADNSQILDGLGFDIPSCGNRHAGLSFRGSRT